MAGFIGGVIPLIGVEALFAAAAAALATAVAAAVASVPSIEFLMLLNFLFIESSFGSCLELPASSLSFLFLSRSSLSFFSLCLLKSSCSFISALFCAFS